MAKTKVKSKQGWPGEAWERLWPEWTTSRSSPLVDVRTGGPSPAVKELVDRLAGYGYTVTEISRLAGLRPSTIYRHFRDELTTSALRRDLEVIESAYFQATGGPPESRNWRHADASMTRFWLGQRRGWKMPTAYDRVPGEKASLDLDRLSEDELHELERLIGRAGDAEGGEGGS
jgi:AcrR family transcriptional regulator